MKGLTKRDVDKIRDAFIEAHDIFKSLEGWPTCSIYRIITHNSTRYGRNDIFAIEIDQINKEVEWDRRQMSKVGVAWVEDSAYNYKLPDLDYRIAIGQFIPELMDPDTGKGGYGPLCPECAGYGKRTYIEESDTSINPSTVWDNKHGDSAQCGYCGGLGLDIHDERIKFYKVLRERPDERMVEWEYDTYLLSDEASSIASVIKTSYDNDAYATYGG